MEGYLLAGRIHVGTLPSVVATTDVNMMAKVSYSPYIKKIFPSAAFASHILCNQVLRLPLNTGAKIPTFGLG